MILNKICNPSFHRTKTLLYHTEKKSLVPLFLLKMTIFYSFFTTEKKCLCRNGGQCIGEGVEEKCICKGGYAGPKCEGKTTIVTSYLSRPAIFIQKPIRSSKKPSHLSEISIQRNLGNLVFRSGQNHTRKLYQEISKNYRETPSLDPGRHFIGPG